MDLQLLVGCCRGRPDSLAACSSRAVSDRLVSLALHHRVVPQLFHAWSRHETLGSLHPSVRDRVTRLHLANAARGAVLIEALRETVAVFATEGVRAFPFKGPALAYQLHGDPCARMLSDIDLLVHEADLVRARKALCAAGWRDMRVMSPAAERAWVRSGWGHNLEHSKSGAIVNLRSRTTPDYLPGRMEWDALWQDRKDVAFEGLVVPGPPDDAMPVLLAWHGAKHAWSRLVWLCDLDALVRQGVVADWRSVLARAESMGVGRMLRLGLLRSASVLDTPVAPDVLEEARRDVPRWCDAYCRQRLDGCRHEAYRWWREEVFYLRLWEGVPSRAARIGMAVFRPTISDYEAVQVPAGMEWVCWLLRPFRIVWKAVSSRR